MMESKPVLWFANQQKQVPSSFDLLSLLEIPGQHWA